jgi:uncharacterized membrane protein
MTRRGWTDERIESIMGILLRTGLILAVAVVLVGGAWYLARHGSEPRDYRVFRGEPSDLRSITGTLHGIRKGQSRCVVQLGLLLLIATPIARVLFSAIAFALQRDRVYVLITMTVFGILIVSLLGGVAAG